jgi:hypothetical protein
MFYVNLHAKKKCVINPILHTAWLESHALTLKNNTSKYYFGEKTSILHTFIKFSPEEQFKSISKTFYFQCYKCFKKVNLYVWQTSHHLFEISGVPVWFRSHHTCECYTLSGYRAISMNHQTAPTSHYRQPSPHFVWHHYLHPFERELLYG